jgi:hypothetical protein
MDHDATAALALVGVIVSVSGSILAIINHTRVRSVCCGQKLEVSLDVEKTSPVEKHNNLKINNPADKSEVKLDV